MNRDIIYLLYIVVISALLGSCNLDQSVDIELPPFEEGIVVESYIEPGQPYTVLITRSSAFFEPFSTQNDQFLENILVNNAEVNIINNGRVIPLENNLVFNSLTRKVFNYSTTRTVPLRFSSEFELQITLADGKTITGKSRMFRPVPIDSIVVEFSEENEKARVLTYLTDPPDVNNFYRRMLHVNRTDTLPLQDFTIDDRVVEDVIIFGSDYRFEPGSKVINTIFHIEKAYYDFLESVESASRANGNPFSQPSPIISNLGGTANAIGIFTCVPRFRQFTTVVR